MASLSSSRAWLALKSHRDNFAGTHLTELFAADPQRFENFSLRAGDMLLDYSKNLVSAETMQLLSRSRASAASATKSSACSTAKKST